MEKKGLTAKQIQFMKPDPERRIEVAVGAPSGLYLVLHPTGRKGWALRYRFRGRPRNLTFGTAYPEMSLAAARAEAQSAIADLAQDIDPARTKERDDEAQLQMQESVANVVEEFLKRQVRPNEKRWKETERILKRETEGWKCRSISDVTKPDVLRVLDSIVDRGASVMACRTRGVLMRFFDWSKGRGYIEQSPMAGVGKPGSDHKSRDRVLGPEELTEVWRAAGDLGYPSGPLVRLLTLTAQRRGEVASMRWQDVDLDGALWTVPAEMTKPDRVHDVPLSGPAIDLLNSLPRFESGPFIFSTTSGAKPISGWSKAKLRLDAKIIEGRKERLTDWTLHDLRRTAATHMAKAGVPVPVLSAILNHSPGSVQGITAIYNRFRYTEERRQALESWADFVLTLAEPKLKKRKKATA